jgi:hypothetical protein
MVGTSSLHPISCLSKRQTPWYNPLTMGIQDFFIRQMMKAKMKDVPEAQREQIMQLVTKDPDLFKKIGEEVDRRVKKGGEPQMKATMEVMKKYREEIGKLMR